jgi:glycosyltransferase involved in cell wall biosynthesis
MSKIKSKLPLISIIIPTYNRAHLIGETLDSIIAQTYKNWECIVVDDRSSDSTVELMDFYCLKDSRIQFHLRPPNRRKGANACRNYGFQLSNGDFINWFDSDDIMLPNHIEELIKPFKGKFNLDFTVGNSLNFDKNNNISRPFDLKNMCEISADNFITGKIGWITNDVLIRSQAIKINFNERLNSHQEYDFFSRFLLQNSLGHFVNLDLTKRRLHGESIQGTLAKNNISKILETFRCDYYLLISFEIDNPKPRTDRLIKRLVRSSYYLSKPMTVNIYQKLTLKLVCQYKTFKFSILYFIWILSNKLLGRGYIFIKMIIDRI